MKFILSLPWPYQNDRRPHNDEDDDLEFYFRDQGLKCKYIPDADSEYRYAVVGEEQDVLFLKIVFPKLPILPQESYRGIHLEYLDEISKSK